MEPALGHWNCDQYKMYATAIYAQRVLTLCTGEPMTVHISGQGLIYVLSGNIFVKGNVIAVNAEETNCCFMRKSGEYTCNAIKADCRILLIDFQMSAHPIGPDGTGELGSILLSVNLPANLPLKKQPLSQSLLTEIANTLRQPNSVCPEKNNVMLTAALLQIIIASRKQEDELLKHISGAAFYSKGNRFRQMEANRTIWYTDIILCEKPNFAIPLSSENILGIFRAYGSQISIPNTGVLHIDEEATTFRDLHVIKISTDERTPYHIGIWPSARLNLDLLSMREDWHAFFFMKSDHIGDIGFTLSSLSNFVDMPQILSIDEKNTWIPIDIGAINGNDAAPSSQYVLRAIRYIEQHYQDSLQVEQIAEYCHISASHLSRLFREQTEKSVNEYIAMHRIGIAKTLMETTDDSLERIAHAVGFYDQQHFARTFLHYLGQRPSEWRKSNAHNTGR